MKRKFLFAAIICFSIAVLTVALGHASSQTTNLKLNKPGKGDRNWGQTVNDNMDKIDSEIATIRSKSDDLPEAYIYTGTFNSTTGTQITLPKAVDNVNEYSVKVTPTSRAGAIGDVYVTKTTSNFTVKCSEANTTDTFSVSVYYIGDVNSYGSSIYRKWYVSPDTGITDHADSSQTGSLAWVQAQISADQAAVELVGNKTYQIKQNLTLNGNLKILRQKGAIIDTDISVRNSNYEWYASGAGTSEYYLQASGGGNPNVHQPGVAIENNSQMTAGNAGSLAAGEWDWNDNDSLGYATIYVRLSDSTDPDGKSADYVEAGYKLTINAGFDPSLCQAFSGNGIVDFGAGVIKEFYPQWWGAKGDGVTDDSTAIQAAGNLATSGGILFFPPGIYLANNLDFSSLNDLRIIGTTPRSSHIADRNGATVLRLNASTKLMKIGGITALENIYLDGNGQGQTLVEMVTANDVTFSEVTFLEGIPAVHATSSVHVRFKNCVFRNCGNGTTTASIYAYNGNTAYVNCSDWWFIECTFEQCTGDQIQSDSSGTGEDNSGFRFILPKYESSYVFLKGTVHHVEIFGGRIRNISGDAINLSFSGSSRIIGSYLEGYNRIVYIVGAYNQVIGCHLQNLDPTTQSNIVIVGDTNKVLGNTIGAYGNVSNLTGNYNYKAMMANEASLVWDPGNLVDGAGETSGAISLTGAQLGDYVMPVSPYSLQGIMMTAWVDSTNVIKIRLQNETGGAIDLPSGTFKVLLIATNR